MYKKEIKGWKWNTLEEFLSANSALNLELGIPKSEDSITQNCMNEMPNLVDGIPNFWYTGFNIQFVSVLGEASIFEIDVPNFFSD